MPRLLDRLPPIDWEKVASLGRMSTPLAEWEKLSDPTPWPRDIPSRPPRRMPSLKKIADYWNLGPYERCARCLYDRVIPETPWKNSSRVLERAHIIDRVFDGLDVVWNILPLCRICHAGQPSFKSGDERAALLWFGIDVWLVDPELESGSE